MSVTTISSMFEVLYECMADKKARAPRPRDRWLEVDPRRFLMYPLGSIFHCEPMPQHQRRLVDVLVEHVTQSGGELYAASVQSYLVLKHSDLYYRAVEPVMGWLPATSPFPLSFPSGCMECLPDQAPGCIQPQDGHHQPQIGPVDHPRLAGDRR